MKYPLFFHFLLIIFYSLPSVAAPDRLIEEMSLSDKAKQEQQRSIVTRLVKENLGYVTLTGAKTDLNYLQKIVDRKMIPKNEGYDLQALGVILGDIMVKNLGLTWVMVEDRYGRSRALRYEDTQNLFFPITMISRRVTSDLPVNVHKLYREVATQVAALQQKRARYRSLPKPKY